VTNTASASGSLLADLQVGGSSRSCDVTKLGQVFVDAGNGLSAAYGFVGQGNTGIAYTGGLVMFNASGNQNVAGFKQDYWGLFSQF
jgi:hypothetical protein